MPFTALSSTEVAAGKPVKNDLTNKIKENFDNHEERISDIESGTIVSYPPVILRVNGRYDLSGTITGVLKTTCNFNLTITGIRLICETAGTSGTTEVDVLYSRAGAAYQTVLTTRPTVTSAAGNDAISSNAVLDPDEVSLQAGDLIRLDLTSFQTGGRNFFVRIDYQKD